MARHHALDRANDDLLHLIRRHGACKSLHAFGFSVVSLDVGLEVLALQVLHFYRLAHVFNHLMHLLHFLGHSLDLLVSSCQCGVIVLVAKQFRINGLLEPLGNLLRARPVHVLDEQIASHLPQVRVALQQLSHRFQRFLTLGRVVRARDDHDVVLADARVVNFIDHDAVFVDDLLDRLGLHRIDLGHARLAIFTNDAGDPLSVVNLRDQVHQLTTNVADEPPIVVDVVVRARVAFLLTGQDGAARALVGRLAQRCVVLARGVFDIVCRAHLGLQQSRRSHRRLGALRQGQHVALAISNVRIDLKIRPVLRVGRFPLVFVALKLATVSNERRLGG